MSRLGYRFKLLLLFLGTVLLLQALSYLAVRTVIRDAVLDQAEEELQRGADLLVQLMENRSQQLALATSVLTDDFGFKEAVASGDRGTIESALINQSERIRADLAIVSSPGGMIVSSTPGDSENFRALLQRVVAARDSANSSSDIYEGRLYQFVYSSVKAPLPIGVAALGFEIDETLSHYFKHLTALEVAFVAVDKETARYLSGTLTSEGQERLVHNPAQRFVSAAPWVSGNEMLINTVALNPQASIYAVLQVPLVEAMQAFAALNTQLLSLTFAFSIVGALVALLLARTVTRPVRVLADAAQEIAAGRYHSVLPQQSNDELGNLAGAFTQMQVAIAEREEKIHYQLRHDALTELENRSQITPRLQAAIGNADAQQEKLLLLVVDIQKFTQVNDSLGDQIGNVLLREVGWRLQDFCGEKGRVLRLGSDEYLLLIPTAEAAQVQNLVQALNDCFHAPFCFADLELRVDLSVGLALYPDDGDRDEVLLRRANLALQHARSKRQAWSRYQQGWDEKHLRRLRLLSEFPTALQAQQFTLHYQPKLYGREAQALGAEALIRWVHPELGFISPDEFISVLEGAGQITVLSRWVIDSAFAQLRSLNQNGLAMQISINLSALDLLDENLPAYVQSKIHAYDLRASDLCFEITESTIMQEAEKSLQSLKNLQALGVKLSIDDYGTGYSSLSQLKKMPVYELKIDKSFILQLDSSEDDQLIVRSTIELGHTLGLKVTAEGVENEASQRLLHSYGCDILQGYFYARPMAAEAFVEWMQRRGHNVVENIRQ